MLASALERADRDVNLRGDFSRRPGFDGTMLRAAFLFALLVTAAFAPCALVFAGSPRATSDLEEALLADMADGTLDGFSLAEATLIASGVTETGTLRAHVARLDACRDQLRGEITALAAREQAAALLRFLHHELLRGRYRAEANDLSAALAGGQFNCLTATTLFLLLADQLDLPAQAYETPGHVCACLLTAGGPVLVECTWPEGFGTNDQRPQKTGRLVSAAALTGAYFYNRGVQAAARGEQPAAVAANLAALRCDPGCDLARDNLLAAWNNWALALAAEGSLPQALRLLDEGRALAPEYRPFALNERYLRSRASRP